MEICETAGWIERLALIPVTDRATCVRFASSETEITLQLVWDETVVMLFVILVTTTELARTVETCVESIVLV